MNVTGTDTDVVKATLDRIDRFIGKAADNGYVGVRELNTLAIPYGRLVGIPQIR